tara:strand:- start:1251 stop:1517 length:267 start_codon:yes stop_codon:yes gene_type:complete
MNVLKELEYYHVVLVSVDYGYAVVNRETMVHEFEGKSLPDCMTTAVALNFAMKNEAWNWINDLDAALADEDDEWADAYYDYDTSDTVN